MRKAKGKVSIGFTETSMIYLVIINNEVELLNKLQEHFNRVGEDVCSGYSIIKWDICYEIHSLLNSC